MLTPCRALLLLPLLALTGLACGEAETPVEVPQDPQPAAETQESPAETTEVQSSEEVTLPEIDPTAVGFLEVHSILNGQPVPNVPFDVHWLDEINPSKTASRTGENGIRRMPFEHGAQVLRVLMNPTAYTAPYTHHEAVFIKGNRTHVVKIDLAPGGIVSGVVLDIEGNPVPGAQVAGFFEAPDTLDQRAMPKARSLSRTDDLGRFRMGGFPQGFFTLEAAVEGQTAVWRPSGLIQAGQELGELEIFLEPSYTAYGQVQDLDEKPIAGARVEAGKPGRRRVARETVHEHVFLYGPRTIIATTAADGTFQIPGVPESQNWLVNVSHPEFKKTIRILEAGQLDIWIDMPRGADLRGTVTDGNLDPLSKVQVWMLTADSEPSQFTDRDGGFFFGALDEMEGVYLILYRPDTGMAFLGPMEIKEGMDPVQVVMSGGKGIHGVVQDTDGNPLSGVGLRIEGKLPEPGFPTMRLPERFLDQYAVLSGADGTFAFEGLYDSEFKVTASAPGKQKAVLEGVKPGGGALILKLSD